MSVMADSDGPKAERHSAVMQKAILWNKVRDGKFTGETGKHGQIQQILH